MPWTGWIRFATLLAVACGWIVVAHAQVSLQRKAPPGFDALEVRSVEQPIHFRGQAQPGMVVVVRSQAGRTVQAGDTVVVSRLSSKPLTALLVQLGVHPRGARAWVDQAEFVLGQSTCLPLQRSSDCMPFSLAADEQGQVALGSEPARPPDARDGELALLGSAYASASWALQGKGGSGVRMGLSTQGMVSSREHYLEYDLLASNTGQANGISPNLLMVGTRLDSGMAAHAGLFRAGGIGGEASATQFFVRPRLLGMALRSDGRMLQPGESAQVRITLLAPARVTILSNGVQLYSALHGLGEQVIALPGQPGNFVDVRTESMTGEVQEFQANVFGSRSNGEQPASWRWELGQTVAEPGGAIGRRPSSLLLTMSHSVPLQAFMGQVAAQWSSGGAARLGFGLLPRTGRWGASAHVGQRGEAAFSGFASARLLNLLHTGISHTRYRAPSWQGVPDTSSPCLLDRTLCYASRSQARSSLSMSLVDFPLHLSLNDSRSGAFASRQLLLRTSIPVHLGSTRTNLQLGYRQMHPTGDRAVFAFLTFTLGTGATLVNTSLSVQRDGRADLAAGYSHRIDDVWDAPASISQSVSGHAGAGSTPPSFHHQFTGRAGPVGTQLSASHGGLGSGFVSASATASYGLSQGRLAFTRYRPELGQLALAPTTMAALKVVNDSADDQMVTLGLRTLAVPARSSLLIPAQVGHSPDVKVAPGPVEDAGRLAMPSYLFAGNIHEVRVRSGGWHRVRFVKPSTDGTAPQALKVSHVRSRPDGAEERIYQDAQGYAFMFESLAEGPLVRYLEVPSGRSTLAYRCEANLSGAEVAPGIYPEVEFQCAASTQGSTPSGR